MLKFFKKHPPKEGEEREKLKKELFAFCKCAEHGFPSKPCALAYDPKLRLMAVGTKNGVIKVYGAPGVEVWAQHDEDVSINALYFLEEQGRLISLCSDNSLRLWEVNFRRGNSVLEQKKDYFMESSKQKTISSSCLSLDGKTMLLGTEGGNIHVLDTEKFTLAEQTIQQEVVMQNVPDDFKVNPGAVEAIAVHPTNPDKFLIGFNRGLIVYWDNKEGKTEQTYNATQQLESLSWNRSGETFMSAHADGSYIVWSVADASTPVEPASTPYGPFPCKAITKVEWMSAKADPFIIFAGGMPRASYGDRHTISVMQGENHVVFDFTSKVIDFITLTRASENDTSDDRAEHDEPHTLLALLEEELVAVDLDSPGWPTFRLPYLHSVHSSAITCSYFISNVAQHLWTKICDAGESQFKNVSKREWPVNGGKNMAKDPSHVKDLLLTGHEDGTVRFWDASGVCLNLLYKLSTASIFGEVPPADQNAVEDEEWPPFRKVGTFDPYSDDPRLGIQKIALCSQSGTLVVAGTAGQVLSFLIEREEREQELKVVKINIVMDRDGFVWKGHDSLVPREGDVKFAAGFQATSVLQIYPPAACTALALHSEWQLVAAGTAHGFCLFDYVQKKEVLSRCTLNPNDMTGTSDTPMSRRKSLKKSLRESFRRLRRRRSERRQQPKKEEKRETPGIEVTGPEGATAAVETGGGDAAAAAVETRPVERAVEARSSDDSMASMVRCLYFADTFIVHGGTHNPSLWIGTNGGHVYIYTLTVPETAEKRATEAVSCLLAKEIKLRHRAPVISMAVLDSRAKVLPPPLDVQHGVAKAPDMSGQHSVVLVSEEQIKAFTLPALKPRWKVKLTAIDGSRIRKVAFVNFRSKSADNYTEFDIACLSNLGDLMVYSVTSLRQQLSVPAIKKEDIHGISSFVFTANGQGLYLHSSSEFCRVSLSPRYAVSAICMLELKEGMREPEPEAAEDNTAVVEVTEEGGQYNAEDISRGMDDSQLNSSQADTTGDITVDSIRDVAAEREAANNTALPVVPEGSSVDPQPAESVPAPVNNHVDDETKTTTKVELNDVADKLKEELCIKGGGDVKTIVTAATVEN